MTDIWLGATYNEPQNRVFVLGESVYGNGLPLVDYIPTWIGKKQRDATFSRVFNCFSGMKTSHASVQDREAFWASIAFYNFVTRSVGPTRKCRPTHADYMAAEEQLSSLLRQYKPAGVVILGIEQSKYSEPIIQRLNIPNVKVPHPTSFGLRTQVLVDAWDELSKKRNG